MSRRTRQSRMAHLCCAMLAGIGTSTIASSAFAQVDSLVKTGQSQAPKDVLSVANYKMELLMGPIDGLTTAWHPAPTETAVPLGTVVEFKVNAPEGAVVQWENAVQTLQSDNAAYAVAICSSPGVDSITCRVNYEGQRFSKELSWDVIPVQASDMIIREVTIREETLEAPALHGMELNLWTMSKFFGASIADIEQVEDGRYVTSVRRAMQVHADVFPPEFAPLVEWRANGVAKGLGASRILSVNEAGMHQLSAGRPDAPASLDLVTYETVGDQQP